MTLPPSGIYKITNLKNGKVYVGQSKNIFKRREQHFIALRRGRHENKEMQADYKTDYRYFRWDVIEFCDVWLLNDREKYWIDHLQTYSPNGYNVGWTPYKRKTTVARTKKYHKTR